MKILILVMSHISDDENFIKYKQIWDKTIEVIKDRKIPIEVKFLYTSLNQDLYKNYIVEGDNLISNCEENYWSSLLIKVINGFEYFMESDNTLVFKTNLSTIINIDSFYNYIKTINHDNKFVYQGVVGHYDGYSFCSGAGMLLNKSSVSKVLENKELITKEWTDDIFIGYVLNKLNDITPLEEGLSRYDIYNELQFIDENQIKNKTHIRIKIRKGNWDSIITEKVYNLLYH